MTIGTRSVLFGAHQFLIHPWFVAAGWWKLYGFPFDPRLWVAFFVHDLGYIGKPNMDGDEGETHVELGARIMSMLFDRRADRNCQVCKGNAYYVRLGQVERCQDCYQRSTVWRDFCLYHSRYYARRDGRHVSSLCLADKLAIALTWSWLYVPMVMLTGEAREYMTRESRQVSANWTPEHQSVWKWHTKVRAWCREYVEEHRDGRPDTWTPGHTMPDAAEKKPEVTFVRRFKRTGHSLGISYVDGSWFVFDRESDDADWHKHCGPYSTAGDARQWIREISETKVR